MGWDPGGHVLPACWCREGEEGEPMSGPKCILPPLPSPEREAGELRLPSSVAVMAGSTPAPMLSMRPMPCMESMLSSCTSLAWPPTAVCTEKPPLPPCEAHPAWGAWVAWAHVEMVSPPFTRPSLPTTRWLLTWGMFPCCSRDTSLCKEQSGQHTIGEVTVAGTRLQSLWEEAAAQRGGSPKRLWGKNFLCPACGCACKLCQVYIDSIKRKGFHT